jgi:hypothetical protein
MSNVDRAMVQLRDKCRGLSWVRGIGADYSTGWSRIVILADPSATIEPQTVPATYYTFPVVIRFAWSKVKV